MPLDMTAMRLEVLEHLGIDAEDLDATGSENLDRLINRTWWSIQDKFPLKEKEALATFDTVAGTRNYELATTLNVDFEAIQLVSYNDPDTNRQVRLDRWEWHYYLNAYSSDDDEQDKPEKYLRHEGDLYLFPTPDDVYTLTVRYLKTLSDLTADIDVPQALHECIMYGAVYRGKLRQNDYAGANNFKREHYQALNEVLSTSKKEDKDNRYSGVEVLGRDY